MAARTGRSSGASGHRSAIIPLYTARLEDLGPGDLASSNASAGTLSPGQAAVAVLNIVGGITHPSLTANDILFLH